MIRSHRNVRSVPLSAMLALVLAAVVPARADAGTEFVLAVGKFAAEKAANWIYDVECKGKTRDGTTEITCGAIGSFGAEEKEWQEEVSKQLRSIETSLERVEGAIATLNFRQQQLLSQNRQILLKLDEVAQETVMLDALATVRTLWDDSFEPFFSGERAFDRRQLVGFAEEVVLRQKVHMLLGKTHASLAKEVAGKEPLIEHYLQRMSDRLLSTGAPFDYLARQDLSPVQELAETVLAKLMMDQTKGYVMMVWALEILEADCTLNGECRNLPFDSSGYKTAFERHLEQQVGFYQDAIEAMVLRRAYHNSHRKMFLSGDALSYFHSADVFAAAALGRFGMRGRVVSMGDRFDGELRIAGRTVKPVGVHRVPVAPNVFEPSSNFRETDWWVASGDDPLVYDEVHFADTWKVYRYEEPSFGVGSHRFETPMPFSHTVNVKLFDRGSGKFVPRGTAPEVVPLGTFTGIQRAGGPYALLSGPWLAQTNRDPLSATGGGKLVDEKQIVVARQAPVQAVVVTSGTVEWKVGLGDQRVSVHNYARLDSRKRVRYPAGGTLLLRLVGHLGGDRLDCECPALSATTFQHARSDFDGAASSWAKSFLTVSLGELGGSNQTLREIVATRNGASGGAISTRVRLDKGRGYPLILLAEARINVATSGMNATGFEVFSVLNQPMVYLRKE